jgi:sirohydrochlorin ferrochelatase
VDEAVSELRATGADRVFVAPYLLTPGPIAEAVARSARDAGAIGVGDVLAGHRLLVDLVVHRYRSAVASWSPHPGAEA